MKLKGAPTLLFLKKLVFKKRKLLHIYILVIAVLIPISFWLITATFLFNGLKDDNGDLVFYNNVIFGDGTVHLSLISELTQRFPPTNFAIGGTFLKNYHYIYDLCLAMISKMFGISVLDVFFRFNPIVLATLYIFTVYFTVKKLTGDVLVSFFAIPLTILVTSFGFAVPIIKNILNLGPSIGAPNVFMTDQVLGMMTNPQGLLSICVFLLLFLLYDQYEVTGKIRYLAVFAFVLAISFGIKAYGGIIFLIGSIVLILSNLWHKKSIKHISIIILGLIGELLIIITFIDKSAAGLAFVPGWTLDQMLTNIDKLNFPYLLIIKQSLIHYQIWWKLILFYLVAFLIYFVGNLGMRIFGLFSLYFFIKKIFIGQKNSWLFLLSCSGASLGIPLFLNQTKKAYDIVQFSPYFLIFFSLLTLIFLSKRLRRLSTISKVLILFIILVVNALFVINEIPTFNSIRNEKIVFSEKLLDAVRFIEHTSKKDDIVLLPPSQVNMNTLWYVSLGHRRTVFSGKYFAFQTGVDVEKYENKINEFFINDRLQDLDFSYVLIRQSEIPTFGRIIGRNNLNVVYSNSEAIVLKKI